LPETAAAFFSAVIARSACDEAIHASAYAFAAPWIASLRSQ
jgi:hypothetical protein